MLPHHKERQYTIASALPKPCFFEDFCSPYAKASEKGPYFLTEYSTHQLFTQLTLLQQVRDRQPGWRAGPTQLTYGASAGMLGCSQAPTDVCWRGTLTCSEGSLVDRCTDQGGCP